MPKIILISMLTVANTLGMIVCKRKKQKKIKMQSKYYITFSVIY